MGLEENARMVSKKSSLFLWYIMLFGHKNHPEDGNEGKLPS